MSKKFMRKLERDIQDYFYPKAFSFRYDPLPIQFRERKCSNIAHHTKLGPFMLRCMDAQNQYEIFHPQSSVAGAIKFNFYRAPKQRAHSEVNRVEARQNLPLQLQQVWFCLQTKTIF